MKRIIFISAMLLSVLSVSAAEPFVVFHPQGDALSLKGAAIVVSEGEHPCVHHAVKNLREDFLRVTRQGFVAEGESSSVSIVIGTVGANRQIDQWVKQGMLKDLKGKTEKYIIKTIDNRMVIAGSDKRGTVYGIYELSRQMGVSPWYYWADVPVARHDDILAVRGEYTDGEPAVRYRGIFLNDEAPCLTSWVKNTFGTDYGDHRFYEKVFELILRLKGNFIWPAMWGWAFYADDPENSRKADEMGIVVGTSHHEPMARNHQEYARKRSKWGPWNYLTNQERLDRFFREGIERMKGTDDVVTIGMRGDGDEAMSEDADTKLLQTIVENQRKIIREVTGKPAKQTPQVWALYKEVLDYYDKGMRVPDDVTILLCDDNWGNVRRVPSDERERKHPGGWGLYYHVDYVGAPRNYKWINVTQTQQMAEQLSLAFDYGIERMWILNVGDLKPMEYPIQLFMDMAWKPREYTVQTITDHTRRFFRSAFGDGVAAEAADIYNRNCQFMARVTPEMLDARTYNAATGEWRQVSDDYMRLETRALRLKDSIPAEAMDAYRQLLLFPVQAMSNLYDMYYSQAMNRLEAGRNSPDANIWAQRVSRCFRRDSLLNAYYNKVMSGGKWNGMMTQKHIGYRQWNDNFPKDRLPATTAVEGGDGGGYVFSHSDGYVSMEAEHYYSAKAGEGTQWTLYPYFGRTRSAMALTPYTSDVGASTLAYRFTLPSGTTPVKVHVVVKSTLDFLNVGGFEYNVAIDGQEAKTVNFNKTLVDRQPYMYSVFYPTVARRIVESVVEMDVPPTDGQHELTLQPRHPGIVFEKIVVDYGGYKPSYLFMNESDYKRQ